MDRAQRTGIPGSRRRSGRENHSRDGYGGVDDFKKCSPISWRNRRSGSTKLKLKEMGRRCLFIYRPNSSKYSGNRVATVDSRRVSATSIIGLQEKRLKRFAFTPPLMLGSES